MKAALALLALAALYMLGRSLGRTLGPAPALDDPTTSAGDYGVMPAEWNGNTLTIDFPQTAAWRLN